ncbi:cell division protein FtsX [Paenibacillus castaneae]|nr:cell division protein FtsX [Paenibacillus castaneae]
MTRISSKKYKNRKQLLQQTEQISKLLRKIITILLILLLCSQALLQFNTVRHWVTGVDEWEGTHLN